MSHRGIPLQNLAWLTALLPLVTSHASYLIAASHGHVDWCVPYWDSCTSISATGRMLPEKIWFKLGMFPAGFCTAALWWLARDWCILSGAARHRLLLNSMAATGCIASFFLILYTAALGEEGDVSQSIRRTGITLAFSLTYIAQLLMTRLLGIIGRQQNNPRILHWHGYMLGLLMLLLATGVTSLLLDAIPSVDYEAIEDAFEWILALQLNLYFAGLALCWRKGHARLSVHLIP